MAGDCGRSPRASREQGAFRRRRAGVPSIARPVEQGSGPQSLLEFCEKSYPANAKADLHAPEAPGLGSRILLLELYRLPLARVSRPEALVPALYGAPVGHARQALRLLSAPHRTGDVASLDVPGIFF